VVPLIFADGATTILLKPRVESLVLLCFKERDKLPAVPALFVRSSIIRSVEV
jgi:hypothetical protein